MKKTIIDNISAWHLATKVGEVMWRFHSTAPTSIVFAFAFPGRQDKKTRC